MVKKKPDTMFQKAYDAIDEWEASPEVSKSLKALEKKVIEVIKKEAPEATESVLKLLADVVKSYLKNIL